MAPSPSGSNFVKFRCGKGKGVDHQQHSQRGTVACPFVLAQCKKMMLKAVVVLALAVGALAGGCYFEEDFTCVKKNAVRCGSDWCHGHCAVDIKKSCDTKVWYKTVCEKEDYCKKIETPCGHDGSDPHGVVCGAEEECVADKKCKLIPAHKKKSFAGWHAEKVSGGFFEVCKDVYTCAPIDPWALEVDEIDVVCTKEYEIVDDMDCVALFARKELWGGLAIPEHKFFLMNHGFSCDKKLVGKIVCLEADAHLKAKVCGDSICDPGYECATREVCSRIATKEPVCAKTPVHTCLGLGATGASLCGNQFCGSHEKCEILSKKVCPQVVPVPVIPVPVPVIPVSPPPPAGGVASASSFSVSVSDEAGTLTDVGVTVSGRGNAAADALATQPGLKSKSNGFVSDVDGADVATAAVNRGSDGIAEAFGTAELN